MVILIILLTFTQQSHSTGNYKLVEELPTHFERQSVILQETVHENDISLSAPLNINIGVKNERKNDFLSSLKICRTCNILEGLYAVFYGCFQSNTKLENSFTNIPNELILHIISGFLDSRSILILSGVNKNLRSIFSDNFWATYVSKLPTALSQLIINGSLAPSSQRKAFFSQLWYREGKINLAARLDHPEAKSICHYEVYISKEQYICHNGKIKYISGKIDTVQTEKLENAKKLETKRQIEKCLERRKIRVLFEKNPLYYRGNIFLE